MGRKRKRSRSAPVPESSSDGDEADLQTEVVFDGLRHFGDIVDAWGALGLQPGTCKQLVALRYLELSAKADRFPTRARKVFMRMLHAMFAFVDFCSLHTQPLTPEFAAVNSARIADPLMFKFPAFPWGEVQYKANRKSWRSYTIDTQRTILANYVNGCPETTVYADDGDSRWVYSVHLEYPHHAGHQRAHHSGMHRKVRIIKREEVIVEAAD